MEKSHRSLSDTEKSNSFFPEYGFFETQLAIIGAGKSCRDLLEFIGKGTLPFKIQVVGIWNPANETEGLLQAKKMGIRTTDTLEDLLNLKGIETILELTGKKEIFLEVVRLKPEGISVLDQNICRMLNKLFDVKKNLKSAQNNLKSTEKELSAEKMLSSFLIQQSTAAIVILNTDFSIVDSNEAYLKTVNRTRKEVIGAHCYEISHGYTQPCDLAGETCPLKNSRYL